MKHIQYVVLLIVSLSVPPAQGQSCSSSNTTFNSAPGGSDASQHDVGQHFMTMSAAQSQCIYTSAPATQANCNTQCTVTNANGSILNPLGGTVSGETPGSELSIFGSHSVAVGWQTGQASGTNTGASCTGVFGGGAVSCGLLTVNCNVGVSFDGSKFNVTSTNGTPIWTSNNPVVNNCGAVPNPSHQGGGGSGGGPICYEVNGKNECVSPIILDVEGEGFHLTSATGGVMFDIEGDGEPMQIAWTDSHYHNAFLALPGSDGLVHNGKQLFGNFTQQPQSDHPNGFVALAQYDKVENGGNENGMIDEGDQIFSKLRLWIDENHDGVCQPGELHTLVEFGVHSISIHYFQSSRIDEYGNAFRYKARVNPGTHRDYRDERPHDEKHEVGRWTYDVFFTTE